MKGLPPKVRVVVVEPLPAHHLEALKELVRRAALRKLRQMQEAQRKRRSRAIVEADSNPR